ncbi:hypothetical protein S40288_04845 [Stachybotrys chartarum IBT 40288]|nr:hypothetical protein S40288_04845 [Stachybotrys chartarum IBT 40288]
MSNTKTTRPGRSNSLQRMLELEKQAMNLRLHAPQSQAPPSPTTPRDTEAPMAAHSARQTSPADLSQPTASKARHGQSASTSSPLPPLAVNFSHPRLSMDETQSATTPGKSNDTPFVTFISDRPSPKVVAFQFPPEVQDIRSVCQSPTWEAYGRAKREKKEEQRGRKEERREKSRERKEEKRAQEQAARDAAPEKKRRLSKPPPVVLQAPTHVYGAAPLSPAAQKSRPRSASALGLGVDYDLEPPVRAPRSRNGSFTSLIRSFEVRRSLVDQKRDGSFIGGIKLEQERHEAQERALENDIHPALRRSRASSRAASPMRSPASASTDTEETKRKAYPPITRQPVQNKRRSSSFSQLTRPELGAMDKLRAFMGGKSHAKEEAADSTTIPNGQAALSSRISSPRQDSNTKPATLQNNHHPHPLASNTATRAVHNRQMSSTNNDDALPIVEPLRLRNKAAPAVPAANRCGLKQGQAEQTLEGGHKTKQYNGSASNTLDRQPDPSQRDGARLGAPPPPRKSSKRSAPARRPPPSLATSNLHATDSHSDDPSSPEDYFDAFNRPYTPPKLDLSILDRKPLTSSSPKPDVTPSHLRPQLSSSDDSYSDASRYSTDMSTPNTSHPQSEKGLSPVPPSIETLPLPRHLANAKPGTPLHPESPSTSAMSVNQRSLRDLQLEADLDLERIQAAAKKVLAAFPEGSAPRSSSDGKRHSQASMASGILPKLKQQAWKSKERMRIAAPTPPESETDDPSRNPLPRGATLTKQAPKSSPQLRGARNRPPLVISAPLPKQPTTLSPNPSPAPAVHDLKPKPLHTGANKPGDQVAKMFVECCSCRYYHDMPSRLYEAMVNPDAVLNAQDSRYAGSLSMTVKCPWCKHEMNTKCCAGLAAMVYIKERLH